MFFLISFANIYANALKQQDEHIKFRRALVVQDLNHLIPKGATAMVIFRGSVGSPKATDRFIAQYGDISRLIHHTIIGNLFFNVSLWHLKPPYTLDGSMQDICEHLETQFGSEVVLDTAYHKIEKTKTCYIVTLN